MSDPSIVRMQLPDGTVPVDLESAAVGWMRAWQTARVECHTAVSLGAVLQAELTALREVIRDYMRDHQCAVRCDGPHADCICIFCRMGAALGGKTP